MSNPLSTLPGWDIAKRMSESDDFEQQLRRAFELQPKYTLSRDLDAERLALQLGEMAGEFERGRG